MLAIDTLAYAKELQEYGFTQQQAEGQAKTLGKIIDENLATKHDIELVRKEIVEVRRDIEEMGMKLTIRLGGMLVVGIGVVATLIKLL